MHCNVNEDQIVRQSTFLCILQGSKMSYYCLQQSYCKGHGNLIVFLLMSVMKNYFKLPSPFVVLKVLKVLKILKIKSMTT
jgi:hypothetical protein